MTMADGVKYSARFLGNRNAAFEFHSDTSELNAIYKLTSYADDKKKIMEFYKSFFGTLNEAKDGVFDYDEIDYFVALFHDNASDKAVYILKHINNKCIGVINHLLLNDKQHDVISELKAAIHTTVGPPVDIGGGEYKLQELNKIREHVAKIKSKCELMELGDDTSRLHALQKINSQFIFVLIQDDVTFWPIVTIVKTIHGPGIMMENAKSTYHVKYMGSDDTSDDGSESDSSDDDGSESDSSDDDGSESISDDGGSESISDDGKIEPKIVEIPEGGDGGPTITHIPVTVPGGVDSMATRTPYIPEQQTSVVGADEPTEPTVTQSPVDIRSDTESVEPLYLDEESVKNPDFFFLMPMVPFKDKKMAKFDFEYDNAPDTYKYYYPISCIVHNNGHFVAVILDDTGKPLKIIDDTTIAPSSNIPRHITMADLKGYTVVFMVYSPDYQQKKKGFVTPVKNCDTCGPHALFSALSVLSRETRRHFKNNDGYDFFNKLSVKSPTADLEVFTAVTADMKMIGPPGRGVDVDAMVDWLITHLGFLFPNQGSRFKIYGKNLYDTTAERLIAASITLALEEDPDDRSGYYYE
jgi:hypothetical protein